MIKKVSIKPKKARISKLKSSNKPLIPTPARVVVDEIFPDILIFIMIFVLFFIVLYAGYAVVTSINNDARNVEIKLNTITKELNLPIDDKILSSKLNDLILSEKEVSTKLDDLKLLLQKQPEEIKELSTKLDDLKLLLQKQPEEIKEVPVSPIPPPVSVISEPKVVIKKTINHPTNRPKRVHKYVQPIPRPDPVRRPRLKKPKIHKAVFTAHKSFCDQSSDGSVEQEIRRKLHNCVV